ncbi:MAG: glycoside hydrolase family 36 protein [Gemmatimonadota bacterium]
MGTAAARELPAEAFFHRGGVRIAEHGRYHLDLRHPAALRHLDEAVDLLAGDLGIGYLKLDYNIRADPGTDSGGISAGAGLLEHNRALLGWLDRVLDRHPGLTIENCASGAMRADYAMLARLQLQSTSDQQDFLRYPVIAAAAPAAITPEQAGIWCYPQPHFSTGEIAFTLCGALLGRIHLSGHLDRMSPAQRELIAGAVSVYKQLRPDLADAVPFWPLGLPRWADSRVALGMRGRTRSYLLVWRRGPRQAAGHGSPQAPAPGKAAAGEHAAVTLPVRHLRSRPAAAQVLFPAGPVAPPRWDAAKGELTVTLPAAPAAGLICLATTT